MLEDFRERLQALHADLDRALEGLPPEALDWTPGPGQNSLGVIFTHTLGAERYWIGDVAGQDPSGRVRDEEFRARGLTPDGLRARSAEVLAHSLDVIARLAAADLGALLPAPITQREVTVAWALLHALEHTAQHLGHIQITRQQWEAAHGSAA